MVFSIGVSGGGTIAAFGGEVQHRLNVAWAVSWHRQEPRCDSLVLTGLKPIQPTRKCFLMLTRAACIFGDENACIWPSNQRLAEFCEFYVTMIGICDFTNENNGFAKASAF
jgi:hypothetical protein